MVDVGNLTEKDVGAAGCPQQEIANFRDVVAILRIECDDDIEYTISFISLADDVTLVRRTDDIEDIDDILWDLEQALDKSQQDSPVTEMFAMAGHAEAELSGHSLLSKAFGAPFQK